MHLKTQKKVKTLFFLAVFCLLSLAALVYLGLWLWGEIKFPFGMKNVFSIGIMAGLAIFLFYSVEYGLAGGFAYGLATGLAVGFDLGFLGTFGLHLIGGAPFSLGYCLTVGLAMSVAIGLTYSLTAGLLAKLISTIVNLRDIHRGYSV